MAPDGQLHRTSHQVEAEAPADIVYGLLADAERWPLIFPPTVHVHRTDGHAGPGSSGGGRGTERLAIWATANGTLKHWTSRRTLDPVARRIDFRQEVPAPPLRSMGGSWTVRELGPARCRITLLHDFSVAGDRPEDVAWVLRATDTNSTAELGRLARLAARPRRLDGMLFAFADSLRIEAEGIGARGVAGGGPALDGSDHARLWPGREAVAVRPPDSGRLVFKVPEPDVPLAVHTGSWTAAADGPDALTVTVRQQVVLRPEADVPRIRQHVREDLGRGARAALTRFRDGHVLIL
ncbi:cyclase [Streptomyces bambusae]|uniref:Cyclase n=1 Tax=Streptomyces bambusae TaxID=1550616 RepID=A0ABS6Z7Z3_9ACTN|nr:cyclase [Streptomyces bambusae]